MRIVNENSFKKEFWIQENVRFSQPHFRLEKCAKVINSSAKGASCDLLDLGCGPATLSHLLQDNIHYYGIDIAIHEAAPNLLEMDLLKQRIHFKDLCFDYVVASGFFEYMGHLQHQKFAEVAGILKDGGKFILTYSNISHRDWSSDQPWNNIETIDEFRDDLKSVFRIERFFASSHNRKCFPPERKLMRKLQMMVNVYLPFISPRLAVEYFFICSKYGSTVVH